MVWTELAYAKLNLTLDILGKRPDGYHDLRMVMQSIDLADQITLEETGGQAVSALSNLRYLPRDKGNIAVKAAELFFQETGLPPRGLRIRLQKTIPVCAGMGGGSSDGAAVLRGLRRMYAPELPWAELERIGALAGSDVPFCVRGGTSLAEGRGERLTALPPLPPCHLVICKPDFSISTPKLFQAVQTRELHCRPDTRGMVEALERGDLAGTAHRFFNVFEELLPQRFQAVREIKGILLDLGALGTAMTGSGPTVFGAFDREPAARDAAEVLCRRWRQTFLTRPAGAF